MFVKDLEYCKEKAKLKRSTATTFALSSGGWSGAASQLDPPELLVLKSGTFLLAPPRLPHKNVHQGSTWDPDTPASPRDIFVDFNKL